MALLERAHDAVGGDVVPPAGPAAGTSTTRPPSCRPARTLLMDTAYAKLDLPFVPALSILRHRHLGQPTAGWAVADCGLKALGMDHGNPSLADGPAGVVLLRRAPDLRPPRASPPVGGRPRPRPARPRRPDRRLPRAPADRPRRRGRGHVAGRPPRLVTAVSTRHPPEIWAEIHAGWWSCAQVSQACPEVSHPAAGLLPMRDHDPLHHLASTQHALVSTSQLRDLGISRRMIDESVRRRRLERVHRGVYRIPGSVVTFEQATLAACLSAGRDGGRLPIDAARSCGISTYGAKPAWSSSRSQRLAATVSRG